MNPDTDQATLCSAVNIRGLSFALYRIYVVIIIFSCFCTGFFKENCNGSCCTGRVSEFVELSSLMVIKYVSE